MASVSSSASTSRNASRAAVKSPASNFSRPWRRLSATRLLPSAISWRAFSMRPTASELLMSIRKMRDHISMACCRFPPRAAWSPRLSRPSISCCGDGGSGAPAAAAALSSAPMLNAAGYPSGPCAGASSPGAGPHMSGGLPASGTGVWNSCSARGPSERFRAPKSGGGGTPGLSKESSSDSESRLRSPRPPDAGVFGSDIPRGMGSSPVGSEMPGFVDSPISWAARAWAAWLARSSSSSAMAGWSGSIERMRSTAARASAGRFPSRAIIARWRALSICGPESLRCRAFSRMACASRFPGSACRTCPAAAIAASNCREFRLSAAPTSSLSTSTEATRSCRVGVAATSASRLATSTAAAGFLALSISCRAGANRGSIFRMKSHPITQSSVLPSLNRFSVCRKVERILSRTSLGRDGFPG